MNRSSLEDVSGLNDPLLVYNFDLVFPRIPGFGGSIRDLTFKCQSTSLPGMQVEQTTTGLHGVEVSHAGRQIWTKTFTATFIETRDCDSRAAFRGWQRYARNNGANRGNYKNGGSGYAVVASLFLYDDIPEVVNEISIFGTWCTNVEDVNLDGTQSGIVLTSITFSYDYTTETKDAE